MAALNPNNTARLFWDYRTQTAGVEHTLQVRPASLSAADRGAAEEAIYDCLSALGTGFFRTTWRVFAAIAAAAGGDITAPAGFLAGLDTFVGSNANTYNADREAVEMRFVGRSPTTGRKVSFSLYGIGGNIPIGTFRITGGASGNPLLVANAVAVLNAAGGALRCIDGSIPLWYNYVNIQYNSYWERRVRIGA